MLDGGGAGMLLSLDKKSLESQVETLRDYLEVDPHSTSYPQPLWGMFERVHGLPERSLMLLFVSLSVSLFLPPSLSLCY